MPQRLPSTPPVLSGMTYQNPLGSGGFADVFLYRQDMPSRPVAIKVMLAHIEDPTVRRMFNSEADVLARLSSHPSILSIYDAGVSADGRPYIAMEYCPDSPGGRYRSEKLPINAVLDAGVRIACALETAHRVGVLHRDLKPSNILITEFGAPVLADFGIATSLNKTAPTEEGAMSVPWSAPEVLTGATAGTVTSEVWGLGATIYSLLAGRSPFEQAGGGGRNSRDQLERRILKASYTPTGRTDVPASLEKVLARTMERDPQKRYQSALEVAQALQGVQMELGLAPTALDVPGANWNTQAVVVDDATAPPRGPIRPTVAAQSNRRKSSVSQTLNPVATNTQPTRKRQWGLVVAAIIAGVVLIAGAVVALVLTGVI